MKRKTFPLRLNEEIIKAVQNWAADDLRSTNAQIEFIVREALWKSGRLKKSKPKSTIDKE